MTETKPSENEQIRSILNANPDLPVMLLTEAVGSWDGYQYYYHEGIEAKVEWLLEPRKLEKELGTTFGLNGEKIYDDEDEATNDIAEWLYDNADEPWDDDDDYTRVARMIVDDMPWEKTIVIWGCL